MKFDEKNRNLLDYFAVLGPREDDLESLVKELIAGDNVRNEKEYGKVEDPDQSEASESTREKSMMFDASLL